jgi:predicted GNAT family N-acyltransferase
MNPKFVSINGPEYSNICELRYRLFFAEHNLPFNIWFDDKESASLHVIIAGNNENEVLAYGRMTQTDTHEFRISQMVVEPTWQRKGLGRAIMMALIDKADSLGGKTLIIDARTHAIEYYKRFGFEQISGVFPSQKTGIPHVTMQKPIKKGL